MFTNIIPQNLQNEILAKGIPALSEATATHRINSFTINPDGRNINMNNTCKDENNGWSRNHPKYQAAF